MRLHCVFVNKRSVFVNNRSTALRHSTITVNNRSVTVKCRSASVKHRSKCVRYLTIAVKHRSPSVNERSLSVNNRSPTVNYRSASVRYRSDLLKFGSFCYRCSIFKSLNFFNLESNQNKSSNPNLNNVKSRNNKYTFTTFNSRPLALQIFKSSNLLNLQINIKITISTLTKTEHQFSYFLRWLRCHSKFLCVHRYNACVQFLTINCKTQQCRISH